MLVAAMLYYVRLVSIIVEFYVLSSLSYEWKIIDPHEKERMPEASFLVAIIIVVDRT